MAALASSLVVIAATVYRVYRDPHTFDNLLGKSVPDAQHDVRSSDPPRWVPTVPNEECGDVDLELLANVQDRTPSQSRDNHAIDHLLCVAANDRFQNVPPAARRDVQLANLLSTPAVYRGQYLRVQGVLARLITIDLPENTSPLGFDRFHEAWVFTDRQAQVPHVLFFSEIPPGLEPGDSLRLDVTFDAYFLKVFTYRDRDNRSRPAPLLVGHRIILPPSRDISNASREATLLGAGLIGLMMFATLVYSILHRRQTRRTRDLLDRARSESVGKEPVFVEPDESADEPS
jgi:hypothetical protein